YADAESAWQGCRDACVYERVKAMPEQTFPRAWNDMPAKGRFYIPISFEGSRQHFGVDPNGSVFCRYNWLRQIRGNDTDRCLYDGDSIRYTFGLSEGDLVDRSRVDGCLPMIGAVWTRDGVRYRQTAFAVPLAGVPEEGGAVRADDTIVLMIRFEMSSLDGADHEAHLEFAVYDDAKEALTTDGEYVFVADTDPPRLRLRIAPQGQDLCALRAEDGRILYAASVSGDVATRVVDVAVPYITFTTLGEWHALRALDYDVAFDAVKAYWTARLDEGTQIATPEPMVNEFYRAHTAHLLLNTEREVGDSERYVAKVGTFSYGAFSNESCMMVSDLDRRGYAKRAEQALETWLHYQGAVPLPGDFSNTDGQFYGAGGYEHGGYNQHHGFVLWCLGEHYWYTRDRAWLEHAAPHIVRGCDWIVHERARTIAEAESNPLRAIERGLLPPGYLEDIRDWRSWLSTNVYSWWGMHNAAAALADAGLPDGARLVDEAEAYRRDILDAFMQATRRSPVIQLRDGGWVPHVPAEVHRRGRTFGWITETLEGGIHMIRTGLIEPNDPLATWIIKDYEDNLYISKQYGYEMSDDEFEQYWFSRGGISMQANLLCNPIPYLLRDEPEHFLRAYFNAFAASYFPDTRMMTEHALPKLGDWRGDHYKSSDEANSTYWLRLMFLEERGDKLRVGAAVPRYWLASKEPIGVTNAQTYFGPASVTYEADPDGKRINLCLDPPRRNPPRIIYARFRHPDKKRMIACEVDGKAYDRFDADEEWVMLTDCGGSVTVSAIYE
ncbi:MAG TPA: hypothetical protein PK468_20225, partial [Candidatus Hydrogenedentes bacterium]|nr:hypothetical protein [Candidatus Hydrogenedentota bacterium]